MPTGAQAGDIVLEPCDYETEGGTYAADCRTLVVPENRADPGSRLIALPVTRIKARTDDPGEPVFRLEGGPGGTNMQFVGRASRTGLSRVESTGMASETHPQVRRATGADAPVFGRLLQAFNEEYDEPTPSADAIAERAVPLIESGEVTVLFVGDGPDGFAELRFRPSLYTGGLDAYLEELYVVPERRGHGLGRALLEAAMDFARARGADRIDLNTSEDDVAARGLYESTGFTNREGSPDGPTMLYYEREL